MAPDERERARRAAIVQDTRVSTALEGGRVPAAVEALQDEWVAGLITFDELSAEVRRMYPSSADQD